MLKILFLTFITFFCFENIVKPGEQERERGGAAKQTVRISARCLCVDPTIFFEIGPKSMATSILKQSDGWREKASHAVQFASGRTEIDLYPVLEEMPAKNETVTYTKGVQAPRILSDWLTGKKNIDQEVNHFLKTSDHSLASLTRATVAVLCQPGTLAENHYPIIENFEIFAQLKKRFGVTLCLAGNYAHPQSLNFHHGKHMGIFDLQYLSGAMKLVKPNPLFFERFANKLEEDHAPEEILFIETEPRHCPQKETGFQSLVVNPKDRQSVLINLANKGFPLK